MHEENKPRPGVSRDERISSDGLERLERQLAAGSKINDSVLQQWVRRYGEQAETLIARYREK